jgi:hypothetical protein
VEELQGIDRQIADIRSSLDGALGASIDDDSKVAARCDAARALITRAIRPTRRKF